jgi:hypothetical protein
LLVGVAADGLADHERLPTGRSQIDHANEAVEPARQQRNAILRGIDRIARRRRQHPTLLKPQCPAVGCQKSKCLRKRRRLARPENGIRNRNVDLEFASPSVRAMIAQTRKISGHD